MNYQILIVLTILALLEVVHATVAQRIKITKPDLYRQLGRTGPGYYFFGLFWIAPKYRMFLTKRIFVTELSEYPAPVGLANIEFVLWYTMWIALILVVFGGAW